MSFRRAPAHFWMRFATAIPACLFLGAGVSGADAPNLVGAWEFKDPASGESSTVVFNADGTGALNSDAVRYAVVGDRIRIVVAGETIEYGFKLDGDALTVSGGDLDRPETYRRKGAAPKRGLGARVKTATAPPPPAADPLFGSWALDAGGRTITMKLDPGGAGSFNNAPMQWTAKDGRLTTVVNGQSRNYRFGLVGDALSLTTPENGQPLTFRRSARAAAPAAGLTGRWRGEDGTLIEFTPDGKFLLGGRAIPFTQAGGSLKLAGANGEVVWPYQLARDSLVLDVGGVRQPYTRVGAAPSAAPPVGIAPPAAAAPAGGIVGVWRDESGQEVRISDRSLTLEGSEIPYTAAPGVLRVNAQGNEMQWPFRLEGDRLVLNIGGTDVALTRAGPAPAAIPGGPAAPPPAAGGAPAGGIVGDWLGPGGFVRVRDDGTLLMGGQEARYSADAQFITVQDGQQWVKIPYKLDADKMIIGTGPVQTLVRARGPEGIWVGSESSVDPTIVMSITQYITLYPDGSVGFTKSELGASRRQISEQMERFMYSREQQGNPGGNYGRWQADGGTLVIQWQGAFGNRAVQGRFDLRANKMSLPGMGILQEGADLTYDRQ